MYQSYTHEITLFHKNFLLLLQNHTKQLKCKGILICILLNMYSGKHALSICQYTFIPKANCFPFYTNFKTKVNMRFYLYHNLYRQVRTKQIRKGFQNQRFNQETDKIKIYANTIR